MLWLIILNAGRAAHACTVNEGCQGGNLYFMSEPAAMILNHFPHFFKPNMGIFPILWDKKVAKNVYAPLLDGD